MIGMIYDNNNNNTLQSTGDIRSYTSDLLCKIPAGTGNKLRKNLHLYPKKKYIITLTSPQTHYHTLDSVLSLRNFIYSLLPVFLTAITNSKERNYLFELHKGNLERIM